MLFTLASMPRSGWRGFYTQYADQSPQLADASLVYVAETLRIDAVFTLDQRDFSIYRTSDGRVLRIVPET